MPNELNAKVTGRIEFAPGSFVLRVAYADRPLPEFVPGQYGVLGLPGAALRTPLSDPENPPADPAKMIRRAYSVASSSLAREYVEFYITLVRSGALTPRLYHLAIGDGVWLGPKFTGMLTMDEVPPDRNVVLMATGTGVAPYMSMLRTRIMKGGLDRRCAVIHGARHSWDLGYRSELETMARLVPGFSYFPVVSEPGAEPAAWSGATGFMEDFWKSGELDRAWGGHPAPSDTNVFLCGNPLMIESALRFLGAEGFKEKTRQEPGEIHLERFW